MEKSTCESRLIYIYSARKFSDGGSITPLLKWKNKLDECGDFHDRNRNFIDKGTTPIEGEVLFPAYIVFFGERKVLRVQREQIE